MSKQTAVEWLESQLDFLYQYMSERDRSKLFELAKAMEKEQIIEANRDGVDMVINEKNFVTGEAYYNQEYGGDK